MTSGGSSSDGGGGREGKVEKYATGLWYLHHIYIKITKEIGIKGPITLLSYYI